MTRTDTVCSPGVLRRLLCLEDDEAFGEEPIGTHDGEWRIEANGQWRHWDHDDVAAEREVAR